MITDQVFPPEVPKSGDLLQITPVKEEYVPKQYKFFCVEAAVVSRFFAIDHADRKYVILYLNGEIREINFDLEHGTWSTNFDHQRLQVEINQILE